MARKKQMSTADAEKLNTSQTQSTEAPASQTTESQPGSSQPRRSARLRSQSAEPESQDASAHTQPARSRKRKVPVEPTIEEEPSPPSPPKAKTTKPKRNTRATRTATPTSQPEESVEPKPKRAKTAASKAVEPTEPKAKRTKAATPQPPEPQAKRDIVTASRPLEPTKPKAKRAKKGRSTATRKTKPTPEPEVDNDLAGSRSDTETDQEMTPAADDTNASVGQDTEDEASPFEDNVNLSTEQHIENEVTSSEDNANLFANQDTENEVVPYEDNVNITTEQYTENEATPSEDAVSVSKDDGVDNEATPSEDAVSVSKDDGVDNEATASADDGNSFSEHQSVTADEQDQTVKLEDVDKIDEYIHDSADEDINGNVPESIEEAGTGNESDNEVVASAEYPQLPTLQQSDNDAAGSADEQSVELEIVDIVEEIAGDDDAHTTDEEEHGSQPENEPSNLADVETIASMDDAYPSTESKAEPVYESNEIVDTEMTDVSNASEEDETAQTTGQDGDVPAQGPSCKTHATERSYTPYTPYTPHNPVRIPFFAEPESLDGEAARFLKFCLEKPFSYFLEVNAQAEKSRSHFLPNPDSPFWEDPTQCMLEKASQWAERPLTLDDPEYRDYIFSCNVDTDDLRILAYENTKMVQALEANRERLLKSAREVREATKRDHAHSAREYEAIARQKALQDRLYQKTRDELAAQEQENIQQRMAIADEKRRNKRQREETQDHVKSLERENKRVVRATQKNEPNIKVLVKNYKITVLGATNKTDMDRIERLLVFGPNPTNASQGVFYKKLRDDIDVLDREQIGTMRGDARLGRWPYKQQGNGDGATDIRLPSTPRGASQVLTQDGPHSASSWSVRNVMGSVAGSVSKWLPFAPRASFPADDGGEERPQTAPGRRANFFQSPARRGAQASASDAEINSHRFDGPSGMGRYTGDLTAPLTDGSVLPDLTEFDARTFPFPTLTVLPKQPPKSPVEPSMQVLTEEATEEQVHVPTTRVTKKPRRRNLRAGSQNAAPVQTQVAAAPSGTQQSATVQPATEHSTAKEAASQPAAAGQSAVNTNMLSPAREQGGATFGGTLGGTDSVTGGNIPARNPMLELKIIPRDQRPPNDIFGDAPRRPGLFDSIPVQPSGSEAPVDPKSRQFNFKPKIPLKPSPYHTSMQLVNYRVSLQKSIEEAYNLPKEQRWTHQQLGKRERMHSVRIGDLIPPTASPVRTYKEFEKTGTGSYGLDADFFEEHESDLDETVVVPYEFAKQYLQPNKRQRLAPPEEEYPSPPPEPDGLPEQLPETLSFGLTASWFAGDDYLGTEPEPPEWENQHLVTEKEIEIIKKWLTPLEGHLVEKESDDNHMKSYKKTCREGNCRFELGISQRAWIDLKARWEKHSAIEAEKAKKPNNFTGFSDLESPCATAMYTPTDFHPVETEDEQQGKDGQDRKDRKDDDEPRRLERARSQAERYKPKKPSNLHAAARVMSSPVGPDGEPRNDYTLDFVDYLLDVEWEHNEFDEFDETVPDPFAIFDDERAIDDEEVEEVVDDMIDDISVEVFSEMYSDALLGEWLLPDLSGIVVPERPKEDDEDGGPGRTDLSAEDLKALRDACALIKGEAAKAG